MIRLESQHDVEFPRETLWPILSKTDWLNRSVGLPPVEYDISSRVEGGSWVTARARIFGREMRWRELPFEWLEPEYYHVKRVFETGPFLEAKLGIELHEKSNGKTRVVVFCDVVPRNTLGKIFAQRVLGPKTKRDMQRVMAHTEEFLRGKQQVRLPRLPVQPVNERALHAGFEKLGASDQPERLRKRLEKWLREAADVELSNIRPFAIAREWGEERWETLGLFLHATRAGLLDFSWEILCPNCRTSRQPTTTSLRQIKNAAHCEVCQIKFDAEFDKSVELKFAVSTAVRRREMQEFCLAGPGGKPHVVGQVWLDPLEERAWKLPAAGNRLRLYSPQVKERFDVEAASCCGRTIACETVGFSLRGEGSKTAQDFTVTNPNSFPVQVSLEQPDWSDDILTAARATNWQEFRDLFATEVISPSEQVVVGAQVVLFTDLRGSTAMYHRLGDARAYAIVRNHFAVLADVIGQRHGTVVKTIGDAVMATFSRLDEALAAAREIHRRLREGSASSELTLKSGLHSGPCLAVNANDKLDFFGTTINLAARIVECCDGGDLTISDEVFQRAETTQFLKENDRKAEASEVCFRGFEQAHQVWRIRMV